jgi:tetratricopeptide (TPR) repeat protein
MHRGKLLFTALLFTLLALAAVFFGSSGSGARGADGAGIGNLFSRGLEKENDGDCISAIYIFQDVLERNRYFVDAKIALARCYYKTGNLAESETLLLEALGQEKTSVAARNLLGRVYISMGKFEDAEKMFRGSLRVEPADIDAKYGLADLFRVKRDFKKAIGIYEEALKLYPQDARTYMHLGNCYTEMGELDRAGGFFRKAVSLDSQSVWTHLNLARYYYRMGVREDAAGRSVGDRASDRYFDAAIHEANTALEVEKRAPEPRAVIAAVHFYRKDYDKALAMYREIAQMDRRGAGPVSPSSTASSATSAASPEGPSSTPATISPAPPDSSGSLLLYEMGYCYEMLRDLRGAEEAYSTALARRIDDEVVRFRLEEVTLTLYRESLSERKRIELSDIHYEKARFDLDRNLMGKAAVRFRRAIQLDPLNSKKRLGLAEMYRARRFYEQYVFELREIIKGALGVDTVDINDRIEVHQNRIANSVASSWRVSQFQEDEKERDYFPRTRTRVAVFDAFDSDYVTENFLHRRLSKTFREMLSLQLGTYAKLDVVDVWDPVESRQDALKRALAVGADYYVTGAIEEREDSLKVRASLQSGFNGKPVAEFDTYYTGNDKVFNSAFSLAESINGAAPLLGQIVRLQANRALINLGTAHGARKDMKFLIFRKGGLRKSPESGEYIVNPEVALGTLTVTAVDEMVSEGNYVYTGLHDRVNVYDSVLLMKEEKTKEAALPESGF